MLRHLRASAAMKNFSEFRQEASTLHALQHPCIVALLGITIHPLAFALELAPLGSLNTVLAENAKGRAGAGMGEQGPRAGPVGRVVLDQWMGQVRADEWNRSPGLPTLLVRLPKTKKQKGKRFVSLGLIPNSAQGILLG